MQLTRIIIRNYRLLTEAELNVDQKMTLIVGRNNTAKTSCFSLIEKVLKNSKLSYDDYPLCKRKTLYELLSQFMSKHITYDDLCKRIPLTSIEFFVDYSLDDFDANLGSLSPFIIDVDVETTTAYIRAEYKLKMNEDQLYHTLEPYFYINGEFKYDCEKVREALIASYNFLFGLVVSAVNPNDHTDTQVKNNKDLSVLFPLYIVPAERTLGEDGNQNSGSLSTLITNYFDVNIENIDPNIVNEVKELRRKVEDANRNVQKHSDRLLSSILEKTIGFGYPNAEELKLSVNTKLRIDDQIKNNTLLSYVTDSEAETLPSSHNGLGYKNLIKMQFLLASYSKEIEHGNIACIPLLFIEEPESHMHPQMQQSFANFLETFIEGISEVSIQTFLTTHSAYIANSIDFSKIRYAQKRTDGVIYKDLTLFTLEKPENLDFIKKYLTLSRCDLFFADKVIFVEGASERLLLPDMIRKCDEEKLFESQIFKLPSQYYTVIEIGGAYAHKFVPFANFLGIPCLILTDIDSIDSKNKKTVVQTGITTSNSTLKWWYREVKGIPQTDKNLIDLSAIINMNDTDRTIQKCHLEFQLQENGLCGRSLEESIMNVNRAHYELADNITENDIKFSEKGKTDFALNLVCNNPVYSVPQYIKNGLIWLNNQKVLY